MDWEGIFSDVYQYVSLEGHLEILWGKTLPQLLEKWLPLQGERAHSQTPISIQIKSKSNPIHFLLFFLPLSPGPTWELCGSYHLFQSCFSFFVRLHRQPFGSYHLFQYKKRTLVLCWGAYLIPSGKGVGGGGGVLATCSYRGSLFPAPIPLCVSFCAWTIHGLPTQSKDPYFVQDNPWIVQIHTLSLTYILAFVLCTVWLVVFRKSMSIFEIEIASIFSVFAIWFCIIYTCLRSLYCMAGCIQNHRTDGRTELSSTD